MGLLKKIVTRGAGTESQYPIHVSNASLASTLTAYEGNCHCGRVKYTVQYPSLQTKQVVVCNCSLCSAHGLIMIHPLRKNVEFRKGYDDQGSYQTGTKTMLFCKGCGVSTIFEIATPQSPGEEACGVNVRTLQGLNLEQLNCFYYDGASLAPQYVVPD